MTSSNTGFLENTKNPCLPSDDDFIRLILADDVNDMKGLQ
jgi:hypothetical protein